MVVLGGVAAAFVLLIPFAITPSQYDRFRVLKESLSRAEGILGGFVLVVAVALAGSERLREMLRERALLATVAAGTVWTLLTTALSTHRLYSIDALVTFLTSVLIFAAVWYAAPRVSLAIVDVLLFAVIANTVLAVLQAYGIYQPFSVNPVDPPNYGITGWIDNPNVLGSYLALACVILAAGASRVPGVRRWLYALGAICAAAGVVVSQARTALLAAIFGVVLVGIGRSARRAAIVIIAVAVLLGAAVAFRVPVVMRVVAIPEVAQREGLEAATSGRMGPILAGLVMLRDHPVTGTGPGTFRAHYMEYKVRAQEQYRRALRGSGATMFGEVHNDHVQIAAELGLPGYLLFLAFVVVLVRAVRKSEGAGVRNDFARALAIPLAGAFLVLCLAQFPLHVAVTRQLIVTFAGLLAGWSATATAWSEK